MYGSSGIAERLAGRVSGTVLVRTDNFGELSVNFLCRLTDLNDYFYQCRSLNT